MPTTDNAERYQTDYRGAGERGPSGDKFGGDAGKENREGSELGAGKGDGAKDRPGDLKESNLSLPAAGGDKGSDGGDHKHSSAATADRSGGASPGGALSAAIAEANRKSEKDGSGKSTKEKN